VEEENYMDDIPCTNIVSFVMYAMFYTHPNITYLVSIVIKFMSNLG